MTPQLFLSFFFFSATWKTLSWMMIVSQRKKMCFTVAHQTRLKNVLIKKICLPHHVQVGHLYNINLYMEYQPCSNGMLTFEVFLLLCQISNKYSIPDLIMRSQNIFLNKVVDFINIFEQPIQKLFILIFRALNKLAFSIL